MKKRIFADFDIFKKRALDGLGKDDARISIIGDSSTSAQQECYFVISAHWLSGECKMKDAITDFVRLPASHTGENPMKFIMDTLLNFDIARDIFGVTVDHTANIKNCLEFHAPALRGQRILKGCGGESK